jgi:hypothetical protein
MIEFGIVGVLNQHRSTSLISDLGTFQIVSTSPLDLGIRRQNRAGSSILGMDLAVKPYELLT